MVGFLFLCFHIVYDTLNAGSIHNAYTHFNDPSNPANNGILFSQRFGGPSSRNFIITFILGIVLPLVPATGFFALLYTDKPQNRSAISRWIHLIFTVLVCVGLAGLLFYYGYLWMRANTLPNDVDHYVPFNPFNDDLYCCNTEAFAQDPNCPNAPTMTVCGALNGSNIALSDLQGNRAMVYRFFALLGILVIFLTNAIFTGLLNISLWNIPIVERSREKQTEIGAINIAVVNALRGGENAKV